MKNLVIGPGAMAFFTFLGIVAKLKNNLQLDDLEAISGASAGALLGFMYCLTKGDTAKILDSALTINVKHIMKPNIKNLLKEYGLVSPSKVRKVLTELCQTFLEKDDVTFQELYEWYPIKLYISSYCVDATKTVYFSVESSPGMSVLDAAIASIAIPFLFSSLKLNDGWNYIDGGYAENTPGAPFLGKGDVLAIKIAWNLPAEIKDLKSYAINILLASMKMRHEYEYPTLDISVPNDEIFDFAASNEVKLKLFLRGYDFFLLKK